MSTLIIPCAGKSNRFPNMKPKWLLTHPDGELMIEKSISGLNLNIFDRIIITIVKYHDEKYEAQLILSQVFKNNPKVEICVLDDFTSCASETIYLTLEKMNVIGNFIVKDSDNYVKVDIEQDFKNFVVSYDLNLHQNVSNIPAKSFLIANKQNIIQNIIEKNIVSNIICIGVYAFEDVENFKQGYLALVNKDIKGEIFISHVISYLLSLKKYVFLRKEANDYNDWGTLREWRETQKAYRTFFVDVDGILLKNCGKYGSKNWFNNKETISQNIEMIKFLQNNGGQIIITTSREEECRKDLVELLNKNGIYPHSVIMGLNHSQRVIINDFAPTNPYPSALAINCPRNSLIEEYLQ